MGGGFVGDYFGNFITEEFNNGGRKHIAGGWVSNSGYKSHSTASHQNKGFYGGRAIFIILED